MLPTLSERAQQRQHRLAARSVGKARALWPLVDVDDLDGTWPRFSATAIKTLSGAQRDAAAAGVAYVEAAADADGISPAELSPVPDAFAGYASDGRSLETLMVLPLVDVKERIAAGQTPSSAMSSGWIRVRRIFDTQVLDAARIAAGVGVTAHRDYSGYVRQLGGAGCPRCAILAGKFYRWNSGFARHVHCKCVHVPTTTAQWRASEDTIRNSPRTYFDSLSQAEQDRLFTQAGAQAIRDGADINQVVNARRGMYVAGGRRFTREGTTLRGLAGRRLTSGGAASQKTGGRYTRVKIPRLTPEQIYRDAEGKRDEAIRLLIRFGYL